MSLGKEIYRFGLHTTQDNLCRNGATLIRIILHLVRGIRLHGVPIRYKTVRGIYITINYLHNLLSLHRLHPMFFTNNNQYFPFSRRSLHFVRVYTVYVPSSPIYIHTEPTTGSKSAPGGNLAHLTHFFNEKIYQSIPTLTNRQHTTTTFP